MEIVGLGVMVVSPEAWSALAAAISCVVAICALAVAWRQVAVAKQQVAVGEQQTRMAEAQQEAARQQLRASAWAMIAQLDAILRVYEAERSWVKEQAEKPAKDQATGRDQHDIGGYMGVFERLSELLKAGPDFVSEDTAYALYGSRLRELLKTGRVRRILGQSPTGWASFISLSLKLDDYARQQGSKPVIVIQGPGAASPEPDKDYRMKLEALQR